MEIALPEVDAVPCARCGAPLALTALVDHATCAHCRQKQPIHPGLFARLDAYRAAVERELPAILERLRSREVWAHRGKTASARTVALVVVAVLFLLELVVGLPAATLLDRLRVVSLATSLGAMGAVFGAGVVAALGVAVVTWAGLGRRSGAPPLSVPDVDVRCSACGGDNVMRSGQARARCRYCGVELVASRDKIEHVVRALVAARRGAALEAHAARRALYTPRANLPLLRRSEAYYQEQVAKAYGDPAASGAAACFRALAVELGGDYLEGDACLEWLDRHWAGVHAGTDYFWTHPRFGVALSHLGYPVLVDGRPPSRPGALASAAVLLATSEAAPSALAPELAGCLVHVGYEITVTRGGVVASPPGLDPPAKQGGAPPAPTAALVRGVVGALAHAAGSLRLGPPESANGGSGAAGVS